MFIGQSNSNTQAEDRLLAAMQIFPRVHEVYKTTTTSDATASQELRRRIIAYATNPVPDTLSALPEAIQRYVQKVVNESHKITDRDIEQLKNCGYTEDFIFEVTVTASLGAGLRRYQAGMDALS